LEAQQRLDGIATTPLNEDGQKRLSTLRDDFTKLVSTYQLRSSSSGDSATSAATKTPNQAVVNWNRKFSDVERDLVAILGAGPALNATSTTAVAATPGVGGPLEQPTAPSATASARTSFAAAQGDTTARPSPQSGAGLPQAANGAPTADAAPISGSNPVGTGVGTRSNSQVTGASSSPTTSPASGTPAGGTGAASATGGSFSAVSAVALSDIGVKNLDPRIRAELEQVRTSVELFYDAATRVGTP
jgi:hypothetical protein